MSRFDDTINAEAATNAVLPDGRVLLGSGNVDGSDASERTDFRYCYPDYMFKVRPRVSYVNETIDVANYFGIGVPHNTKLAEVALVGWAP